MSAHHFPVAIYTDGWQGASEAELLASHGLHESTHCTIPSFTDFRAYAVISRQLLALHRAERRYLFERLALDLGTVVERLRRGDPTP